MEEVKEFGEIETQLTGLLRDVLLPIAHALRRFW